MSNRTIWARTTVEQLMSRQFVRPRHCDQFATSGAASQDRNRGLFRPGLRVVDVGRLTRPQVNRWLDQPAGALIEG